MISMQVGLAATASLNWLIMVSGAQAENCSLSSTPKALAACAAPVWRARVAPSPGLPPICMYIVSPAPIRSSAEAHGIACAATTSMVPVNRAFRHFMVNFLSLLLFRLELVEQLRGLL